VPIKPSAAQEIVPLIEALRGSDGPRREAAIARLAVMGSRAVERLVTTYREAADRDTRVAVLRVLEGIRDRRGLDVARDALSGDEEVAAAGAAALQSLLESPQGQVAAEALDALMGTALSRNVARQTRLAACRALEGAPADVRARVIAALQSDPDLEIRSRSASAAAAHSADAIWHDALEGRLPDDPRLLRKALSVRASAASLTKLQKLIDGFRAREASDAAMRAEWQSVRGLLHQALARRGSRVALYDLRESLASASSPLPVSFLAAVHELGDTSCLEALASAHARVDDAWWRQQIASAFREIVAREKITRRHPVLKRIAARLPRSLQQLMEPTTK
jgi:hypothetical protein